MPEPVIQELDFASDPYIERARAIERAGVFGEVYRDEDGEAHSFAALAPVALEAHEQLSLDLSGYNERHLIRAALAEKLEREVNPGAPETWLHKYPERLRMARLSGQSGLRLRDGKMIVYWDNKAGLSRLCPDDAREEAMRLRRRVLPRVRELRDDGHRMLYAVFTMPNSAAGSLRRGMETICERFRALLKARDADGAPVFPQIKGALSVLEAPLGASRDWNIHLNVIMPTRGFVDFAELRQRWGWNVHLRWIGDKPGQFEAAFSELIKYAVAATVAKSAEHAQDGKTRAPPMLDWTRDELLEWLRAMKGFRRTRAYGALYKLDQPDREDTGPILWLGNVRFSGGSYVHSVSLLDSIPEDNFRGLSKIERWQALVRALAPGGLVGAGSIGEHAPRFNEVMA
jgi:hypothetical protein